jgi:hypothetical protein
MSSKMNINKNNYEVWFLDYFENQLSAEQVAELFLFLEAHPFLKEEFDLFENTILPIDLMEEENLLNKQSLKKYDVVCEENINDWFIAALEGELDAQQLQNLGRFLNEHPVFLNDQNLIAKTKLAQDHIEHFEQKSNLKQFSSITTGNIQAWLISELQGDLKLNERALLRAFLENHPEFNIDKSNYQKTILHSINAEEFPNKKKLRKGVVIPFYQQKSFYRIAALILLVLGAGIVFTIYQNNNSIEQHVAVIKDSILIPNIDPETQPSENEKQYVALDTLSKTIQPSPQKRITNPNVPSTNYSVKENLAERKSSIKNKPELPPKIKDRMQEEILGLALKESPTLPVRETFLSVERRYTPKATIAYENPNEPPSLSEILKASSIANDVLDVTAKGINLVAGEDLVSSSENPIRLPFKSRVLKFLAKTVGKISNDKIKVRTNFNPITGKLSAYEIQTSKKTIQRQFEITNY